MLQTEHCSLASTAALPASLQVLSLRDDPIGYTVHTRLELLLAPCRALRELYLLECNVSNVGLLNLPAVAACCSALRVLGLQLYVQYPEQILHGEVSPCFAQQHALTRQCYHCPWFWV